MMKRDPSCALPARVCILRLSALGDCANVVPTIHTLQAARPDVEITWIINRSEAALVHDLPGVEVIGFDKRGGRVGIRDLKSRLAGRRFDVLLDMHASWRANRISRLVSAEHRVGFDARRARDAQRLFVDERIAPVNSRHVVDGFLAFAAHIGAMQPVFDWSVPISDQDRAHAVSLLGHDTRPLLVISPCSSHARRNWLAARYAAVADYAIREQGMRCVLVGGSGDLEYRTGQSIARAMSEPVDNLMGATRLKQLLALLEHGRVLLCPDSGPAHMANATGIATVALHAATDPRRSGPYRCRDLCVDYFARAAESYRHAKPDELAWGTRIEDDDDVMALIPVDAVTTALDRALAKPIPATG